MSDKITLRPSGNKSRFGYRGEKRRYSVFKAEWNKEWAPIEEKKTRKLCEKHGVDVEQFFDPEDKPNRKWSYVYIRAKRALEDPRYPFILKHRPGISPFYRW